MKSQKPGQQLAGRVTHFSPAFQTVACCKSSMLFIFMVFGWSRLAWPGAAAAAPASYPLVVVCDVFLCSHCTFTRKPMCCRLLLKVETKNNKHRTSTSFIGHMKKFLRCFSSRACEAYWPRCGGLGNGSLLVGSPLPLNSPILSLNVVLHFIDDRNGMLIR